MALLEEDRRFDAIQEFLNLNSAQQLDPVLDSLQTLRRLAKNISASEIAETDKKAKQLLRDLAAIQNELKTFGEIKHRLTEVKNYARKDAKRRPAKPQSGNIIPFPTAFKTEEPVISSEQPAGTAESSPFISQAPLEQSLAGPQAPEPRELPAQQNLSLSEEPEEIVQPAPANFGGRIDEQAVGSQSTDVAPIEAESPAEEADLQPSKPFVAEALREAPQPVVEAPAAAPSRQSGENTPSLDAALAAPQPDASPAVAAMIDSTPAAASESAPSPPQDVPAKHKGDDFDQGLLKELIKDYGEFDSYSSLSPASASAKKNVSAPAVSARAPAVAVDQPLRADPGARSADFDQEVRELIKTYGKVDIYSTQAENRKRIVKRSLAAGLVLTAVLSGSYFFFFKEAPQPAAPQIQAGSASSPAEPLAPASDGEKNTGASGGEVSTKR